MSTIPSLLISARGLEGFVENRSVRIREMSLPSTSPSLLMSALLQEIEVGVGVIVGSGVGVDVGIGVGVG